jgi:hypothetical protein
MDVSGVDLYDKHFIILYRKHMYTNDMWVQKHAWILHVLQRVGVGGMYVCEHVCL